MAMSMVTGWIPYLSAWCQGRVGSYCYIPSSPVLPENRKWSIFIRIREPPGTRWLGLPFRVAGLGGLVIESYPPTLNCRVVQ
jgi:hypothetical protein